MKQLIWTLALAACLGAGAAQAQDKKVNLKISLWVPPSHPLVQSVRDWAADMTKQSGGTITATIFPAEQLGKAFDHYDMARDGIADVTWVSPGYQPGRFPIFNARAAAVHDIGRAKPGRPRWTEWYAPIAATEMADTHFCLAFIADPGTLHTKIRVTLPEDVRGLKIRPGAGDRGADDDRARRHQRAGFHRGGARDYRPWCGQRDHRLLELAVPVRDQ